MGLLWKEMSVSRAFSTYPSGSPAREPSFQVPFTELPQRETLPEPLQNDGMRESDKYWCKNKKSQLRILAIKIYKYRQNTTKYIILYHF